jgi:predicted MPP superfamily phosphohydrolase
MLREAQPDIIAITGDLIDSRSTDIAAALSFVREAVKIAPCYYATGNHEARIEEYSELEQGIQAAGVAVLRNAAVTLEREGQQIQIIGLDDYTFFSGENGWACVLSMLSQLEPMNREGYDILLAHRPEFWAEYVQTEVELILAGHAHGGQIRLPFVGGLYSPDQGFFPKWDCGSYTQEDTTMVVSRGLGNSLFPLRVNNRPEVVIITLEKE